MPSLAVEVVPFEEHMAEALVEMWRQSFEHGVGIRDWHPLDEQRNFLLSQVVPNFTVRVAVARKSILGFVAYNAEALSQLYVRLGHYRQGIGASLLDLAKSQSSGSLWLYTFAQNHVARSFYEKHDFVAGAQGFEPMWQLADVRYEWRAKSYAT